MEENVENTPVEGGEAGKTEATATSETVVSGDNAPAEKPKETIEEKVPVGVQKRIDQITAQKYEAQRKADYLEGKLAALEKTAETKPATPDGKPKASDFTDYDEYIAATSRYEANQAFMAAEQARQAKEQERTFTEKINKFKATHPDFDAIIANPELKVSQTLYEVVKSSDMSAELIYHLGNNPAEALRLSHLPPVQVAREIGKLEAKLDVPSAPVKKVSMAPAPITPVSAATTTEVDINKMSTDDYVNKRLVELRTRR